MERQQETRPLDPRQNGMTRSQRRMARVQQQQQQQQEQENQIEREGTDDEEEETIEPLRGPPEDVERLINEAIQKRKQSHQSSAYATSFIEQEEALNDENHEEEILGNYEYLDHTADIQLHSWGESLEEALGWLPIAMFGYMTKLSFIEIDDEFSKEHASDVVSKAHDIPSLVFAFLQEWLYIFHDTGFVAKKVRIHSIDRDNFVVHSSGEGEKLCIHGDDSNKKRHIQGTEIKAVTYSSLQVLEEKIDDKSRCDIYVIVDI